ncbi:hypothetical protein F3Y22_tig00110266pilonHSYRG00140 [Hibiscus syriacus]|uniref:Reverse transcriptase domain-containing protein n=1 Tax=Hibiscus syriacus TaxID=106335 RepID=A0A6A3B863_HIBSY|nr:hypothetical protein F3Y22_tig00110266pilonHSYRG00140 [Hibiscus syriacus]
MSELQTTKFLYACAVKSLILKDKWLTDSIAAGSALSPAKYTVLLNQPETTPTRIGKPVRHDNSAYIFNGIGVMLHGKPHFCTKFAKHGGGRVFGTLLWLIQNLDAEKICLAVIVSEGENRASRHLRQCALERKIPMMWSSVFKRSFSESNCFITIAGLGLMLCFILSLYAAMRLDPNLGTMYDAELGLRVKLHFRWFKPCWDSVKVKTLSSPSIREGKPLNFKEAASVVLRYFNQLFSFKLLFAGYPGVTSCLPSSAPLETTRNFLNLQNADGYRLNCSSPIANFLGRRSLQTAEQSISELSLISSGVTAAKAGLLAGCVVGKSPSAIEIFHHQYADDLIMFWGASETQVRNAKRVLRTFELASSLELNLKKCVVYGVNIEERELARWANIIGMPTSVYSKLNDLFSRFLWGGSQNKKTIHWQSWNEVCKLVDFGGLGFGDLKQKSFGLLGKWCRRYCNEVLSPWKQIITAKYNLDHKSILPPNSQSRGASWIWSGILSTFIGNGVEKSLNDFFQLQVGDGKVIKFWHDTWLVDRPLKEVFPRIFALPTNKEGPISDFGAKSDTGWGWNILLRRAGFDWERHQWEGLIRLLDGFEFVITFRLDEMASLKRMVAWMGIAPFKVEAFVWRVLWQRVPVRVELEKRGVSLPELETPGNGGTSFLFLLGNLESLRS